MRTLVFAGLAVAIAAVPASADAKRDSVRGARSPHVGIAPHMRPAFHRWGGKRDGRWQAGWGAPGGWNAYRRPARGFVVHRYWIQPSFHIANFGYYGLGQPYPGTAWSRYYDDAVMIDGRGTVYGSAHGIDWDRYDDADDDDYAEDYADADAEDRGERDDAYFEEEYRRDYQDYDWRDHDKRAYRRDDGAGGALLGGAVGAIAGNRIAGRGNRTEGTLIGAGVGAVAGAIIDREEDRGRRVAEPYADDYGDPGHADDRVTNRGDVVVRHADGYHGKHRRGGAHYAVPAPQLRYDHAGLYYGAPTITTVTIHPAVTTTTTTTTTFVEEVAYAAPKKTWRAKPVRRWKPKPRCTCK